MISILKCSGLGAESFLQGQLTSNIKALEYDHLQLSACCNLQGRVIFTAYILKPSSKAVFHDKSSPYPYFLLFFPEVMDEKIEAHLGKYAKFSKSQLEKITNQDLKTSILDFAYSIQTHFFSKKEIILNGIPIIYPETSDEFLPQGLNLHLIPNAMSFKKGCYLGQEIIARLHFKGKLKYHLCLGEVNSKLDISINHTITNSLNEAEGKILDLIQEDDKKIFLFVNAIDNLIPYINEQAIHILTLPYSSIDS